MRAAVSVHDDLLKEIVSSRRGHVVKTLGDGVMAAFVDPADAVAAMVDAQRALRDVDWPDPLGVVDVRAGVHCGFAEATPDGDDLLGPTVNRAARIAAAAHGGQILVSAATHELVGGRAEGVSFVDMGEHQLRGLAHPQRLAQVLAPGLRAEFPPLRTGDPPTNVPQQVSEIHGRERELDELVELVGECRLVTVTGTGGVGKTTLALEIGRRRRALHPAGVWFIELARLSDGRRVATESLGAMRRPAVPDRDHLDGLVEELRGQRTLLILDNCEHLLDDVSVLVTAVLAQCADVAFVVTSREPLGVPGEHVWPVPTLSLPTAASAVSVLESDAGLLFRARARLADPAFDIDQSNARFVADVCERLDGLPLAIELACARLRSMSVGDLARRLDDRFGLLTGVGGAQSHHRTLYDTVAWSYELLAESERRLLRWLSVFSGGFDLEVVESIGGASALDDLDHLVAQSLVQHQDGRYRMLETIRQFGIDRLRDGGEFEQCCTKQLDWLEALARTGARQLEGPHQLEWMDRFRGEIDNIGAAFDWAAHNDPVRGATIVSSLTRFFWMCSTEADARRAAESRSYLSEGYDWATELLEGAGEELPDRTRARLQMGIGGMLCVRSGRFREGCERVEEAMSLFREIGDERGLGWATFYSAVAGWPLREVGATIDLLRAARVTLDSVGDRAGATYSALVLGYALVVADRADESRPIVEELREQIDELGVPTLSAHAADSIVLHDAWEDCVTQRTLDDAALAVSSFLDLDNYACVSHTLGGVAMMLGRARDVEAAGLVIGLAFAVRNRLNLVLAPYEDRSRETVVVLEQSIEAAGGSTDGLRERWAAAVDRGRTLEPDEGLDMVLEKLRNGQPGLPWLTSA